MRNLKLLIEYDGTNYHGWQIQPNGLTIQEVMEKRLEKMLGHPCRLIASGRTDAGVHALGQVANFRTPSPIPVEGLRRGLNSLLPPDILVKAVEEAPPAFHARFGARRKTYAYSILNRELPSALGRHFCWHVARPLELAAMEKAAFRLLGRQDFSSFQAADPEPADPVREVFQAEWNRRPEGMLCFTIQADGFLKHMVRNIVGTLVDVGQGRISSGEFVELLALKDRRRAGRTAPARGLFLKEVAFARTE
ncbi:MAG: tRNA pseudouridine(38-40) synthase TruA [Deltaproteobacteria bacterium]|nr:tRNA pseudouridine(38-40) synthase TruA [Deltaproteobacteria bacterium]